MNPEILFLIIARGGSKGIPGKNLKKIGGLSLIALRAISARNSKYCSRLVISTDSPEIQAEAAKYGVEVPFTRPAKPADDAASSDSVLLHAIEYFETVENRRYDAIMLLQAAAPFARASDYDAAVEIYVRTKASLVLGLREMEVNSVFVGPLSEDGRANRITEKFADMDDVRRQVQEKEYTPNGALYLIDWEHEKRTGRRYGDPENTYAYVMDRFHSMDIDEPADLHIAELLVESGDIDLSDWQ